MTRQTAILHRTVVDDAWVGDNNNNNNNNASDNDSNNNDIESTVAARKEKLVKGWIDMLRD